jgi:hypothetical protein
MAFHAQVRAEDLLDETSMSKSREESRRKAAVARRLVRKLNLNRRQATRLLPIVEKAAKLHIENYQEQARLQPELIDAFTEFAREDSLNQGFSRAVERRTATVSHRAREIREQLSTDLLELEKQAAAFLTESQLQRLDPDHRRRYRARGNDPGGEALASAQQKLDSLRKLVHPEPGPIGRYLLHPLAAEVLCEIAGTKPSKTIRQAVGIFEYGTAMFPASEVEAQRDEVRKLRDEINNWNLINGLNLNGDQINRILALYQQAPQLQLVGAHMGPKASDRPREALVTLEREVEQVLNEGQLQVLAEYKTCLIPPKNLKDPVRIGQATDNSQIERWLTRARKASSRRLQELVDLALEREQEHFGELSPAQRRDRETQLLETARQAAAMSDVDFELNKAELAERIAPRDRLQEAKQEFDALSRARGMPGRVARFMLNPQFIKQLRQRGRQLAAGVDAKPADLAKGPQAENCEKSCAIKK